MKKIAILTGSELRHVFFRKFVGASRGIDVAACFCEGTEKSLGVLMQAENEKSLREYHLQNRKQSEHDFFNLYVQAVEDAVAPVNLPWGSINEPAYAGALMKLNPDLVVAYGCSIIREPLLSFFSGRLLNVHLGLSPYYRGSGTNYWPLVNGEPEYVGATFMHMDAGIDTGEIIHQMPARILWGDTPAQIGNRLIVEMTSVYCDLVRLFDELKPMPPLPEPTGSRFYRKRDFTEASVAVLYANFRQGLIEKFLAEEDKRRSEVALITHSVMAGELIL